MQPYIFPTRIEAQMKGKNAVALTTAYRALTKSRGERDACANAHVVMGYRNHASVRTAATRVIAVRSRKIHMSSCQNAFLAAKVCESPPLSGCAARTHSLYARLMSSGLAVALNPR